METNINTGMRWARGTAGVNDSRVALQKFRKPLFDYLVSGLEARDKWVRVMAAGMLGALGDPCAAGYLKPLAEDYDADLREVARSSMRMLYSHRSFPLTGRQDPCEGCITRIISENSRTRRKDVLMAGL
jgi:HEAT repeat protein